MDEQYPVDMSRLRDCTSSVCSRDHRNLIAEKNSPPEVKDKKISQISAMHTC